jgi:hypothetical protein
MRMRCENERRGCAGFAGRWGARRKRGGEWAVLCAYDERELLCAEGGRCVLVAVVVVGAGRERLNWVGPGAL